jgi:hypothetical protein
LGNIYFNVVGIDLENEMGQKRIDALNESLLLKKCLIEPYSFFWKKIQMRQFQNSIKLKAGKNCQCDTRIIKTCAVRRMS